MDICPTDSVFTLKTSFNLNCLLSGQLIPNRIALGVKASCRNIGRTQVNSYAWAQILLLLCDGFSRGDTTQTYLLWQKNPWQTKVTTASNSKWLNQWFGVRVGSYWQECGGKINYNEQRWLKSSCTTPKPTSRKLTIHKSCNLAVHCATCRQVWKIGSVQLSWLESPPGIIDCFYKASLQPSQTLRSS